MKITRREFLTLSGLSTAGSVLFAACGVPEEALIVQSPLEMPEDVVRGRDAWYATICGACDGGEGVVVRVMEGRAKKVAGNPDFPVNLGKQSARCDAALQMLYHPDRIRRPLFRRTRADSLRAITWAEAEQVLRGYMQGATGRMTLATNPLRGHLGWVAAGFAEAFGGRHIAFDPLEQGVLHGAIQNVFGQDRLPEFDIGNARTVLSFGADFLGTWVSPVRYSVKYGQFRGGQERGYLIHIEPRMSVTASAADRWLAPTPGSEGHIALGIARVIIDEQLVPAENIAAYTANLPAGALEPYGPDQVSAASGVPADMIRAVARRFAGERPSLAIGGGSAGAHTNGSFSLSAIYALNVLTGSVGAPGGVIFNPASPLPDVPGTAGGASFQLWEEELAHWRAGNVNTVILRGANVAHDLPRSVDVPGALANVPNIVAFATVLDDTSARADLVLPEKTYLEDWGTDIPEPGPGYQVIGFQQPVVSPALNRAGTELLSDSRGFGDMLLWASDGALGFSTMEELVRDGGAQLFNAAAGAGSVNAPNATLFMNGVLQRGGWWNTGATAPADPPPLPSVVQGAAAPSFSASEVLGAGEDFHLIPFKTQGLLDGRLAAAPWAQGTPDPMSSAAWSTWVEINSGVAARLGIREGDRLFVRSTTGEIEALAYPHPGVPPHVVGIPIGQGNQHSGRYAEERGANILSILVDMKDEATGALAWSATRVKVLRAGGRRRVPKFEGTVPAFPVEPGVPILTVAPGQTARQAEEQAHREHLEHISH